MAAQPWKSHNWFVSQWNYAPEVTKDFKFPKQIKIHDITLRDGEQQTGIIMTMDDKIRIAEALAEAGVHRIEAGMPIVSPSDAAAIKEIVVQRVKEDAGRVAGLLAGQGDVINNVPVEELSRFNQHPRVRAEKVEGVRMYFLAMNCTQKPFDNKLVRQAINYAVDPTVIPLGSRVEIEIYKDKGPFQANDTGKKIKGRHIDIFVGGVTIEEANQLGTKRSKVTIL